MDPSGNLTLSDTESSSERLENSERDDERAKFVSSALSTSSDTIDPENTAQEEPSVKIVTNPLRKAIFSLVRVQKENEELSQAMWMFIFEMVVQMVVFTFGIVVILLKAEQSISFFAENERANIGVFLVSVTSLGLGFSIFCGKAAWKYNCVMVFIVGRLIGISIIALKFASTLAVKILMIIVAILMSVPEIIVVNQLRKIALLQGNKHED